MTQQPRRRRGVILTSLGKQKLLAAIREFEAEHHFGEKYTIEELSGQTGLDPGTVAKVLDAEEGADRRTIDRFFQTFGLELTDADYRRPASNQTPQTEDPQIKAQAASQPQPDSPSQSPKSKIQNHLDWAEAVDVSIFYGRTEELTTLRHWVLTDRCRLVALLGMGGIGKTSLAARLGEQLQDQFEYGVWRSLKDAPPPEETLASLIQFVSNQQETEADLPAAINARIARLLEYLRHHRCLVVLDNAESILQEGQAGVYRDGYEGYGELLKRVGEASHQSCLILTSREKPRELTAIEGASLPVRCWQMRGMADVDGQEILMIKGLALSEAEEQSKELIHRCAGNPLALKLIATTIQELFDGDIAEFLKQQTIAFAEIRTLLDQHFDRLSDLEQSIMYWLTINREPVPFQTLQEDIIPPVSRGELLEALKGLVGRSLVEKTTACFTQQAVVMEYVTERLIEQFCQGIEAANIVLLNHHACIKASAKEYIRETQFRLIFRPIVNNLLLSFGYGDAVIERLKAILSMLREASLYRAGYAAGNLLNLLLELDANLSQFDFSGLAVWQAYLKGKKARSINFSGSDLSKSVFSKNLASTWSVALSSDGELLAAGDTDGLIHGWQVGNREQAFLLEGHRGWVRSLIFSPDCKTLISGCEDQEIRFWNVETGECFKVLQGHCDRVYSLDISSDGLLLVSGSSDRTIKFWNIQTGELLGSLTGHVGGVRSVRFMRQNQQVISASHDQTIKLWNVNTGECLRTFEGHTDWILSINVSPDNRLIASASHDQTIRLWDIASGKCLQTLIGHKNTIREVMFSPKGEIFASVSEDCTIKLWDVETSTCFKTLVGHTDWVVSAAFSADGQILASGSGDQTVRLWDVNTGYCLTTFHGYMHRVTSIALHPNGQTLVSTGSDFSVKVWDLETEQCIQTFPDHAGWTGSAEFHPNSRWFAYYSRKSIYIRDADTYQLISTFREPNGGIREMAFAPDQEVLATGGKDKTVKLWDLSINQCITTLRGHTNWVTSVAFSPDGKLLASGSLDQTIRLWEVSTGKCVCLLKGHSLGVSSLAFSPNGHILVSGSDDQTLRVWDVQTGQCIQCWQGHAERVYPVIFSPDGQTIASGGKDNCLKLWDAATEQCLQVFQGHTHWVTSILFDVNGQTLFSSSEDGTIKVWNVQTGECRSTLRTPRPYENMDITGVTGLTEAQKASLMALGAVDRNSFSRSH